MLIYDFADNSIRDAQGRFIATAPSIDVAAWAYQGITFRCKNIPDSFKVV